MEHWSSCAVHNEPAYPAGECDCGGITPYSRLCVALLRLRYILCAATGMFHLASVRKVFRLHEDFSSPVFCLYCSGRALGSHAGFLSALKIGHTSKVQKREDNCDK